MLRPLQDQRQGGYVQKRTNTAVLSKMCTCSVKTQYYPLKLLKVFTIQIIYKCFAFVNNISSFIVDEYVCHFFCHLHSKGVILVLSADVYDMVEDYTVYSSGVITAGDEMVTVGLYACLARCGGQLVIGGTTGLLRVEATLFYC